MSKRITDIDGFNLKFLPGEHRPELACSFSKPLFGEISVHDLDSKYNMELIRNMVTRDMRALLCDRAYGMTIGAYDLLLFWDDDGRLHAVGSVTVLMNSVELPCRAVSFPYHATYISDEEYGR